MKFNKQELRKAAEKATEGNYVVGHCDINKHGNLSSVYVCQEWNGMAGGVVAECHVNCLTKNSDQVYANAGFMALASPANVISLLEEISTLESRCAELAAENAGLKEACGGDGSYRDCPACAHSEYIEAPETPYTDAFLAEVRAQGVEEFLRNSQLPYQIATVLADYDNVDDATLQTVIWSGQPPEPDGDVWHLEYVSRGNAIVRAVLKELRKGVQS
ncbi:ead/Ea22-like family protein [Citrobacter freundii]|uniref:ead/Ea22-like family protein n=1 Tax=Citrobacter freundii TaxID=546 RepID=UPI0023AE729C|nr:ead/Ea22-like family protein [Citrobacter freundii]